MPLRLKWFVAGIVVTIIAIVAGAYLFVKLGGVAMETTARPLPFEATLAHMALRASIGDAGRRDNPLPYNDANMLAGANVFKEHCAFCHGLPGQPSKLSTEMFPPPPQLFEPDQMVTDDPEGVTHWKVTHGIRLSAMPGFEPELPDTQRWQATMLVAHADKLPPAVRAALSR
jgi:mono/diheme cytochrome c family protein